MTYTLTIRRPDGTSCERPMTAGELRSLKNFLDYVEDKTGRDMTAQGKTCVIKTGALLVEALKIRVFS